MFTTYTVNSELGILPSPGLTERLGFLFVVEHELFISKSVEMGKKSSAKRQSLKNVVRHSRKAAKKKTIETRQLSHDAVLHLRRMANMSTKEGGALLSNVSLLESSEDSSGELSSSSSESTCTSLSLTSENEHECFETDGKRSRKRRKVIKRK